MYVKINGSDERYNVDVVPFSTQHGNDAVKVIGDMPRTTEGFKIYDDNDNVYNDLSDYIYLYGEDGYTKVEDTDEPGDCTFAPIPPSAYDQLSRRISAVSNQVNEITPYTETKKVYIGDSEIIFENVYKDGNISAFLTIDGEQKPCDISTFENYIRVTFEEAQEVGQLTISVQ